MNQNQNISNNDKDDNAVEFRLDANGVQVPTRWSIIKALIAQGSYMHLDQIAEAFSLTDKMQLKGLYSRVEKLHQMGLLQARKKKGYALNPKMPLLVGHVQANAKGYGFVVAEGEKSKKGEDIYLHASQMRRVLDGDKVLITINDHDKKGKNKRNKTEGRIIELLSDEQRQVVGQVVTRNGARCVQPNNSTLPVMPITDQNPVKFELEDVVVTQVIQHPISGKPPMLQVMQNLGHIGSADMPVKRALFEHEIPHEWPSDVQQQMSQQADRFAPSSVQMETTRKDIRELPLVTIDGADARDFDDAVYCEDQGKTWRLIVAIADVSHYVTVDSALDVEASKRGNSVYFPNFVVPMLPPELSNGICSLNPDQDRFCMVCDVQISKKGERQSYQFYPAVMRSHARLTYDEVEKILVEDDQDLAQAWQHVMPNLTQLYALFQKLAKIRDTRGAINFSFPEPLIEYDDKKRIANIAIKQRKHSHQLIEECMLMANVCAAEMLNAHFGDKSIYRNHPPPESDSLEHVRSVLSGFGLQFKGGEKPKAKDYAAVIKQIDKREEISQFIQTLLLRSFSQAEYSCETVGHFALSYPLYTHFTSPIRRYADLIVHRQINAILEQKESRQVTPSKKSLSDCAVQCSFTERRADDATRDVVNWLKAEFMQDKIMQEFDAVITGVTDFGVFVQLTDLFVDGLVHVTTLANDYYVFDEHHYQLIGQKSGRKYRLGDEVRVRLIGVDMETTNIDFEQVLDEAK